MTAASGQLRRLVTIRALSAFSYYAFTPFVPLWAERNLHVSVLAAGGALAVSLLATRAGGLVLPPLIDAIGCRRFVRLSYGCIALGYLVLASKNRIGTVELCGAFAIIGLLQAGSTVALKASIAGLDGGYRGVRGFAALSMAINAGSALGPVFGALLLGAGQRGLPLLAAAAMVAAAAVPVPATAPGSALGRYRFALPDRSLVWFLLAASLTWIAYAAAFDAMPTVAVPLVHQRVVAAAFALNAAVVVAGQPLVTRWLVGRGARHQPAVVMAGANLVAAAGLAVIALMPWAGALALLAGVLVFSSSELVWGPSYDTETLARAGRLPTTAAFGLAGCAFGVAESGAAWIGVAVCGLGGNSSIAAMFAAAAGAGLLAAVLLALVRRPAPRPVSEVSR